jgi:hypothetical protein
VCLVIIATTGKSPTMQALAPVITLFLTDLMLLGLGVFIWTGTIFGYAFAPGQTATIVSGLAPARQNFQSFMIFAFWLNLTAFAIARTSHLLPAWFVLTLLSIALILVPGALATSGRKGFEFMLVLTSWGFVLSIVLAIVMAFQAMGFLGTGEELGRTFRAFLWEATDLETYWLAWLVALLAFWSIEALIGKVRVTESTARTIITTVAIAKSLVSLDFGIALLMWLFGERRALARAWRYLFPYVGFPLEMPVIYTANQAIFIVLTVLSLLVLLYKAV